MISQRVDRGTMGFELYSRKFKVGICTGQGPNLDACPGTATFRVSVTSGLRFQTS